MDEAPASPGDGHGTLPLTDPNGSEVQPNTMSHISKDPSDLDIGRSLRDRIARSRACEHMHYERLVTLQGPGGDVDQPDFERALSDLEAAIERTKRLESIAQRWSGAWVAGFPGAL